MSFNVSITEEAKVIALKYGKNVSQGIVVMEGMIGKDKPANVTEAAVIKRMDKLEEGVRGYNNAFMEFISSGQGAVRVYKDKEKYGFIKASELNNVGDPKAPGV